MQFIFNKKYYQLFLFRKTRARIFNRTGFAIYKHCRGFGLAIERIHTSGMFVYCGSVVNQYGAERTVYIIQLLFLQLCISFNADPVIEKNRILIKYLK